ncbi:MAG: hypothetical protein HYY06_15105 [Deltaproteobacteria bacterium]|nr:hypothetical protein [Deltaproteobacteria bacterium]
MTSWLPVAAVVMAAGCGAPARPLPDRPTRPGAPSELLVRFENEMGSYFRFGRLDLYVDGTLLFMRACADDDTDCPDQMRGRLLHFGVVAAGEHAANANLVYHSNPVGFGAFSYIRAYTFRLRSAHSFVVRRGHRLELSVIAHERGGVTTPIEERPAVRWVERVLPL